MVAIPNNFSFSISREENKIVLYRNPTTPVRTRLFPPGGLPIQFVGLLREHRCQLSSAGAAHPHPLDVIGELHQDFASLNIEANLEFDLVVAWRAQKTGWDAAAHGRR
jgi:hypothetical protein